MEELFRITLFFTVVSIGLLSIVIMRFVKSIEKNINNFDNNFNKIVNDFTEIKNQTIVSLKKIDEVQNSVLKIQNEISEIKERSFVSLDKIDNISDNSNILISKINHQVDYIIDTIKPYQQLAVKSYERFASPINNVITVANALTKAVSVFKSRFK